MKVNQSVNNVLRTVAFLTYAATRETNRYERAVAPRGKFKIKALFYRKDRIKKLKTKLKKIVIKKDMGWCDDPKSKKYNKLIRFPFAQSAEKFFRKDNIYDLIIVLSYNMHPVKKNKGSAIFIHVAKKKIVPTKGCIAINKKELLKLLEFIKKTSLVKIT